MRIRHSIQSAGLIALALVGTAMAAPISMSLVGLDKAVAVDGRAEAILGGGSFDSRVGNPTLANSLTTLFWCVDEENVINPGDGGSSQYNANIILVADTAAQANKVRKGDGTSWEDTFTFTAQQRYNGAAYLVEQIIASDNLGENENRQRAIWRLTDLQGGNNTDVSWQTTDAYVAATTFINANGKTNNIWATVSGVASIGGILSADNTRQTFLVQVAAVPEPSTYALMGGGLILLAAIRRRRAN